MPALLKIEAQLEMGVWLKMGPHAAKDGSVAAETEAEGGTAAKDGSVKMVKMGA